MKKIYCTIIVLLLAPFSYGQDDVIVKQKYTMPKPPAPEVIAKGCDDARDVIRCTNEKVYNAAIKKMTSENIKEIINATEDDTLMVTTKLRFTSKRNLYLHKTSLKFYDYIKGRIKIPVNATVDRLPFTIASAAYVYKGEKYAKSHKLRLLVDRKNNALLPLYDFDSEKRMKDKHDQFLIHPNCNGFTTYEANKKCFRQEIQKLIAQNFNITAAKEAGAPSIIQVKVELLYDENGTLKKTWVVHENSFVTEDIKRILQMIPKVKPAMLNGKPKQLFTTHIIKFKI